jgi:hypothetical protein
MVYQDVLSNILKSNNTVINNFSDFTYVKSVYGRNFYTSNYINDFVKSYIKYIPYSKLPIFNYLDCFYDFFIINLSICFDYRSQDVENNVSFDKNNRNYNLDYLSYDYNKKDVLLYESLVNNISDIENYITISYGKRWIENSGLGYYKKVYYYKINNLKCFYISLNSKSTLVNYKDKSFYIYYKENITDSSNKFTFLSNFYSCYQYQPFLYDFYNKDEFVITSIYPLHLFSKDYDFLIQKEVTKPLLNVFLYGDINIDFSSSYMFFIDFNYYYWLTPTHSFKYFKFKNKDFFNVSYYELPFLDEDYLSKKYKEYKDLLKDINFFINNLVLNNCEIINYNEDNDFSDYTLSFYCKVLDRKKGLIYNFDISLDKKANLKKNIFITDYNNNFISKFSIPNDFNFNSENNKLDEIFNINKEFLTGDLFFEIKEKIKVF